MAPLDTTDGWGRYAHACRECSLREASTVAEKPDRIPQPAVLHRPTMTEPAYPALYQAGSVDEREDLERDRKALELLRAPRLEAQIVALNEARRA
jgi:hypothetical protein